MRPQNSVSRFGTLPILVGLVLLCCALSPSHAEEPGEDPAAAAEGSTQAVSAGGAASRVHVDPLTGEIVPPTSRGGVAPLRDKPFSPELQRAVSTSHRGLTVTRGPKGGSKLHLGGRFRSATTISVPAEGAPSTRCLANSPGAE